MDSTIYVRKPDYKTKAHLSPNKTHQAITLKCLLECEGEEDWVFVNLQALRENNASLFNPDWYIKNEKKYAIHIEKRRIFWGECRRRVPRRVDITGYAISKSKFLAHEYLHLCRICWNGNKWTSPSSDRRKLESKDTYLSKNGFGIEDWLFDFDKQIEGWHYAFLQPLHSAKRIMSMETMNLLLWTITRDKKHCYVGKIEDAQLLSEGLSKFAKEEYENRGWFMRMRQQLKDIGANLDAFEQWISEGSFNIRFKCSECEIFEEPAVPKTGDKSLDGGLYYVLRDCEHDVMQEISQRKAHKVTSTNSCYRNVNYEVELRRDHSWLQNRLIRILQQEYGAQNIRYETGWLGQKVRADIIVECDDLHAFVEVKIGRDCRYAVREAIGQLLEYAFLGDRTIDKDVVLVIATPFEITSEVENYLKLLRTKFNVNIYYVEASVDMEIEKFKLALDDSKHL